MALVEAPVLVDREPQRLKLVQDQMQGPDRPSLDRGEAMVEVEVRSLQPLAGLARLDDSGGGQIDIPPAGETVLQVPLRLAVAQEHQRRHQASTFSEAFERSALAFLSSGRMAWSASRQEAARY